MALLCVTTGTKGVPLVQLFRQQVFFQRQHFLAQAADFQRPRYRRHEAVLFHRLDQVVDGAALHALHGGVQIVGGGHEDDRYVGVARGDFPEKLLAGDVRHGEVEHHHAHLLSLQKRHDLAAVVEGYHVLDARRAQQHACAAQQLRLVVHQ